MQFKQYESLGWGGVLLANGQFKAVYPDAVGCDAFGQYIIDQVVNINQADPVRLTAPEI